MARGHFCSRRRLRPVRRHKQNWITTQHAILLLEIPRRRLDARQVVSVLAGAPRALSTARRDADARC